MVLIAIVIGGFVLISAALLIVLCMFSSRLSAQEGRREVWQEPEPRVPSGARVATR